MDQDTFSKLISTARLRLANTWPFMGQLCLSLRPRLARPDEGIPTACVGIDGTVIFNPDFLSSLSTAEVCGLLAHEVMHPALFYFGRKQGRDAIVTIKQTDPKTGREVSQNISLWNLAHDLSFNLMIADQNSPHIKLPEGAAMDARFRDKSAEEIYDILYREAEQNSKRDGKPSKDGSIGTVDQSSSIGDDARADVSDSEDGKKAARGDSTAQRKLQTEWSVNLASAVQAQDRFDKGQGSLPAWLRRLVDEILNPKLDWREELSRWVGENGPRNDYSFRRPSRRSTGVGEYMPSLVKNGVADDITVLLDTSGSIEPDRLKAALGEIQGICEDLQVSVRVIVVDADIHNDLSIADAMDLVDHVAGGGGSDFRPAFARLEDECYEGCVVAFTDGMISVPATPPPHIKGTLWVLNQGEQPPTTAWGEAIYVPAETATASR